VCYFVCILSVIAIEFLSLTSSEELSTKAVISSRVHSTHALTLHVCATVELCFVTERKKNNKKNEAEFIPRAFPSESPSNQYMKHDLFELRRTEQL